MQELSKMNTIKQYLSQNFRNRFEAVRDFTPSTVLKNKDTEKTYQLFEIQIKGVLVTEINEGKANKLRKYVSYQDINSYEVV